MSVLKRNIRWLGSANHAESDSGTQGGAISKSVKMTFQDRSSSSETMKIQSDNAGDTTPTVTLTVRTASGSLTTDSATLNGTTAAALTGTTSVGRILKAVKSGSTSGTVAAYYDTAVTSGTSQGGSANYITLAAGASAVDDYYLGCVLLATIDATLVIREIVAYDGTNKYAYVHDAFGTDPDDDDTYAIHNGVVFDKISGETEVLTVRRPFYNAVANETGDTKYYYEGFHCYNNSSDTDLTNGVIKITADPTTNVEFGLDSDGVDGEDTSTNRVTAPADYTFNDSDKNIANSQNLTYGHSQQVWVKLTLAAGESPANSYFRLECSGSTT